LFSLRTFVRALAVVALTILVASPYQASAAYVASANITGDIYQNSWTYYSTPRTTNASPYNISFGKTDGPGIRLKYYGCGASSGAGEGAYKYFSDPDPTGYQRIRENRNYGITFCLAAYSQGADTTDTFSGELSWWVA